MEFVCGRLVSSKYKLWLKNFELSNRINKKVLKEKINQVRQKLRKNIISVRNRTV